MAPSTGEGSDSEDCSNTGIGHRHCSPVTDHLLQSSEPEVSSETYQGELERVVGMLGALYNFLLSAAHQPKASEPCTMGVSAIWG